MTTLFVSIDSLAHKVLSVESEISILESFSVFFEGGENLSNKHARMAILSLAGDTLWTGDGTLIPSTMKGKSGTAPDKNFKVDSERAAKTVKLAPRGATVIFSLYIEDTITGEGTSYGQAYMRLHNTINGSGELSTNEMDSVSKHNADSNAHKSLFDDIKFSLSTLRGNIENIVNELIAIEAQARDDAISKAIKEQGIDSLPDTVAGAARSAEAAALSAEATSKALKLTAEHAVQVKKDKEDVSKDVSKVKDERQAFLSEKNDIDIKIGRFFDSYNEIINDIGEVIRNFDDLERSIEEKKDISLFEIGSAEQYSSDLLFSQTAKHSFDLEVQAAGLREELSGLADRGEEVEQKVNAAVKQLDAINETVKSSTELANTTLGKVEDAEKELANQLENFDNKVAAVNDAVSKANTAKVGAEAAKTGAETAQGKAEEAVKDAENVSKSVEETALVATELAENVANANRYTMVLVSNGQLLDRCINHLSDGVTSLTLPAQVDAKKVRDFMVVSVGATGLTFEGGTLLPRDGDDAMLVPEEGTNVFMFTEISPNKFLCSRCTIAEVAV